VRFDHVSKKPGLKLDFGGEEGAAGEGSGSSEGGAGQLWGGEGRGPGEVRYSMVRKADGSMTAHLNVAQGFAIGSKGMYDPQGGTYPPANSLVEDGGDNLLELDVLGRGGGSSVVIKALHVPSMKIVAVKKVPIDDSAKLRQAIHELQQLRTNQVRHTCQSTIDH
jgi:hypothetical protein